MPYGSRFYYPPGFPLSYYEPNSMSTYCLSQSTDVYYVCGYSVTAVDRAEPVYFAPPPTLPSVGEQTLPPASGVLVFQLPQDAQALVDGAPVGLSGGVGATSVAPGRHRVIVRVSGGAMEHTVMVSPHAILTVTPSAVVPNVP